MSAPSIEQIDQLILTLQLQPHPEGGFYRETYRCSEKLEPSALSDRYVGSRAVSTCIYYMLTRNTFSVMHRVASDEIYHFYSGQALEMLLLYPSGKSEVVIVGSDVAAGQMPQFVIPNGVWQGSRVSGGGEFALVGATVAPGFDFADFEEGSYEQLVGQFPDRADLLRALTRK